LSEGWRQASSVPSPPSVCGLLFTSQYVPLFCIDQNRAGYINVFTSGLSICVFVCVCAACVCVCVCVCDVAPQGGRPANGLIPGLAMPCLSARGSPTPKPQLPALRR